MGSTIRFCITPILVIGFLSERVVNSMDDQLVFVNALFRHGIRSPIHVMPNDKFNDKHSWHQGLGELQFEGMQQMYTLGKMLQKRYTDFLSEKYKTYEVYFRSSDVNRTLTSAYFVSAGMYYKDKQWEEKWPIEWQPVPVYTWPRSMDRVLAEDMAACPRLQELDKELEKSPFIRSLYEQNKEFFRYLTKVSGFKDLFPVNVSWVFDNLRSQLVTRKHHWPDWVNGSIYEKTEALSRIYKLRQLGNFERIRLSAGLLLQDIADRLNDQPELLQYGLSRLKFYAYSAHDGNIIMFLSALDYASKTGFNLPDFGSCILIELWQNAQIGRYIKVFYRSSSLENFAELRLANCGQPCRLQTFTTLLRRWVPDDWEVECGAKQKEEKEEEVLKFLIASFSFAIFILFPTITVLITLLYQRHNTKYVKYRQVDSSVLHGLLDENTSESEFSSLEIVDVNK